MKKRSPEFVLIMGGVGLFCFLYSAWNKDILTGLAGIGLIGIAAYHVMTSER